MKKLSYVTVLILLLFTSCSEDDNTINNSATGPQLIVKFVFDENQGRLDNLGNPSTIPAGNAAQTPNFNTMSANYIELAPNALTQLGDGEIIYQGAVTNAGGTTAIDFNLAEIVSEGETFVSIPIANVSPGNYEWVRTSLSYQNYAIDVLSNGVVYNGTLASFVGFNNYITSFAIDTQSITVNENKLQGFWAFEVLGQTFQGQAPEGAITVPNPLFNTSPIPQGSCVVTGAFTTPLTITGNETEDVVVTLSLSINNSFEWQEITADGMYEPSIGETAVDMGFRGLIPSVN